MARTMDLSSGRRRSVSLILLDELLRPGRPEFQRLPLIRYLWRHYQPLILAKPNYDLKMQTKPHHLVIGSIGTGRLMQPVEEMIAWALRKGQLVKNPIVRNLIQKTAMLGRSLHLVFPGQPEELAFLTLVTLIRMANELGVPAVVLHPISEVSRGFLDELKNNLRIGAVGKLADIANFDGLIFVNFAPYSNEDWLARFLKARPDLSQLRAVILTGEPSDGRFQTALPTGQHDGTLREVLLNHELPHTRVYSENHFPYFPYYFDGLQRFQLGGRETRITNADELKRILGGLATDPADFHTFYVSGDVVKLDSLDRMLNQPIVDYLRSGGSVIMLSGIEKSNAPFLSGVFADRALEKDLVRAALSNGKFFASVGKSDGVISDIAPTILKLLGLPIPYQMTGRPLV